MVNLGRRFRKIVSFLLIAAMVMVYPLSAAASETSGDSAQTEGQAQGEGSGNEPGQEEGNLQGSMEGNTSNLEEGTGNSPSSEEGAGNTANSEEGDAQTSGTGGESGTGQGTPEETGSADGETGEQEQSQVIDYVYVESLEVLPGELENIVVSFLDKSIAPESAAIYYTDGNGNEFTADMAAYIEGAMLFNPDTNAELGTYQVQKLVYYIGGEGYTVDFASEGVSASFSVVSEKAETAEEETGEAEVETSVQVVKQDGTVEEVSSIEEGIEIAEQQQTSAAPRMQSRALKSARTSASGNIVIVLDPGHDNQHPGAASAENGINEEVYTLQIAKACRAELLQYNGVEVYLTVEENGDSKWPGSTVAECLQNRVSYAQSVGADLFVSLHLNAASVSNAYGAEVFVSNYSKYNGEGTNLANRVLEELGKLGLSNRGVKVDVDYQQSQGNTYDDGNWVDDLSVIRNSTQSGFPSILVEHGFITNSSDASVIRNRTAELGKADADAIATHLGLSKDGFGINPAGQATVGDTVVLTAYPERIESGYNQYRFIYYDGVAWRSFNDFSSSTTYEWVPSSVSNSYILGLEAKNASGDVKQYIRWSYYSVVEPTVSIRGISVQENKNGMELVLTPNITTNSSSLKYRYQIYDVNRDTWTTLKDNTQDTSVTWSPSRTGGYWFHVVVISPSGQEYTYTMGYTVGADRAYIESFGTSASAIRLGEQVTLSASYKVLADGNNTQQFLVYDGQYWEDVTGSSVDSVVWKPKKAWNYLVCYQITTGAGNVYQSFLNVDVQGNSISTTVNGIDVGQMNSKGEITLKANVNTNDSGLKYTFKAYDMNSWTDIQIGGTSSSVTWTPKKSIAHLLYLEVTGSQGDVHTYSMGYQVPSLVSINSFTADKNSPQGYNSEITLNASASVPSMLGATYEYMYYDGAYWGSISKSDSLKSAVWKPGVGGSYLLCFQIVTESGEIYQSFMGYEITEPMIEIQGISVSAPNQNGEITLGAQVNTNDSGLKYTFKAYDMNSWTDIQIGGTSSRVTWTPKKSIAHLLYLEVTGSTGKTYTYSMGHQVPSLVSINSFTADKNSPQGYNSEITLNASASVPSTLGATYEYMYYDGAYWGSISKSDSLKSAVWKPGVGGSYLLCFQIVTESGEIYQSFMGYEITEPMIEIQGISVSAPNQSGEVTLGAQVNTNDSGLKYTFKAYDMNSWTDIQIGGTNSSVTWKPGSAGVYLLYLEVTGSTGRAYTYACGHEVKDEIRITGLNKSVSSPQQLGSSITLTGQVSALFSEGLTYQYLVYDGAYWEQLSSSNTLQGTAWTPGREGNYSICFQVITKDGAVYQWFEAYTITAPQVNIHGVTVGAINSNKQVSLYANVTSDASALTYTFKAYDMQQWETIVENSTSPQAVWNVKKEGVYLLHLEVKDQLGRSFTYAMGVEVLNNVQVTGLTVNPKSPQKLDNNLRIEMLGTASATYMSGLTFRYMYYDGVYWNLIDEMKDLPTTAVWAPKSIGDFLVCFQVETESGRQFNYFTGYSISSYYYIMGESSATVSQMAAYFKANNPNYDKYTKVSGYDGVLSRGGAPTIEDFCRIYLEEAQAEGVKAEVAFCQAMLETGFLQYGGDVKPDQYNFAGLGATGGGEPGNRFSSVREGIRAQIQHLKCYASTEPLNNPCVDQRWSDHLRGTATTVEALSQKWAVGSDYGDKILNQISNMRNY